MGRAPYFTVVERFGPQDGASWERFVRWSSLDQVVEIVGLDSCLCPPIITDLTDEDWEHNVHEDFRTHLFRDLPYLLTRVPDHKSHNVLAILDGPREDDLAIAPPGFALLGFELLDVHGDISALTNCGGFPMAFDPSELNPVGLLDSLDRAEEVRELLRSEYPDESHAECDIWAVWRSGR